MSAAAEAPRCPPPVLGRSAVPPPPSSPTRARRCRGRAGALGARVHTGLGDAERSPHASCSPSLSAQSAQWAREHAIGTTANIGELASAQGHGNRRRRPRADGRATSTAESEGTAPRRAQTARGDLFDATRRRRRRRHSPPLAAAAVAALTTHSSSGAADIVGCAAHWARPAAARWRRCAR